MMTRRLEVLGALAIGCASGWVFCQAAGCGSAHAGPAQGQILTAQCSVQNNGATFAVQEFPGSSMFDLAASVFVMSPDGNPNAPNPPPTLGSTKYLTDVLYSPIGFADGSVVVRCNPGASSVQLYVRQ